MNFFPRDIGSASSSIDNFLNPFSMKHVRKYLTKRNKKPNHMLKAPWKCDLNQERDVLFSQTALLLLTIGNYRIKIY